MTELFNDTELNLEILAEEAGEIMEVLARIVRMKSKITRFGLTDHHPKNKVQNDHALEEEIGHFMAMLGILTTQGVLSQEAIEKHMERKIATLGHYYYPMRQANIEHLTCGLCGYITKGRQWAKAQPGCGVCPSCYSWLKSNCKDEDHLRECYGDEGYHFNIPEEVPA